MELFLGLRMSPRTLNEILFITRQILLVRRFRQHRQPYGINKCRDENSHIGDNAKLSVRRLQCNGARRDRGEGKGQHEDLLA